MDKITFLASLLYEYYDVDATVAFQQLSGFSIEEGYVVCRIQHSVETSWVARAYRRDRPVPDWFRYFYPWSTDDASDWLLTRAATLVYLEQRGYLAPQVIRTKMGQLIAKVDGWCLLITTFIEGTVLLPTIEQLRLLGATLGHLHTLSPDYAALALPSIGKSNLYLKDVLSNALARLTAIEHQLPGEWVSLHADFRHTCQQLEEHLDLPATIIHADVCAVNAIQTKSNQVILIDWDSGGLGLAILDLGRLLLECHLDSNLPSYVPLAWHIHPDARRVAAVIDGYCQLRMLTEAELDILLDAIRFGVAFIGSLHFYQVIHAKLPDQQWIHSMKRRFARLQNRWAVSQEIASLARKHFEQLQAQR